MDEPFSDLSDDSPVKLPQEDSPNYGKKNQPDTLTDEIFTIKISEEMSIRNALRTGLVEAQGKDTEKMPMYVSWPGWLDDGIVCLYAKDLHELLNMAVKESAVLFGKTFEEKDDKSVPKAVDNDSDLKVEDNIPVSETVDNNSVPEAGTKEPEAEFKPHSFENIEEDK